MSIETVLLVVGTGEENQIDQLAEETITVAGPADAEVVVFHAFSDDEFDEVRSKLGVDEASEGSSADAVAKRHRTTRELAKALDEAGVRYSVRGAVGDHADEVVSAAKREGADRVIIGGRNRSPTGKAVFGSAAQEVILTAPCPVTFVREDAA